MQVIIDEIVSNVRAVDRQSAMSAESMQQIVAACLQAVDEKMAHHERMKEEQSVDGPWAMQPRGAR